MTLLVGHQEEHPACTTMKQGNHREQTLTPASILHAAGHQPMAARHVITANKVKQCGAPLANLLQIYD